MNRHVEPAESGSTGAWIGTDSYALWTLRAYLRDQESPGEFGYFGEEQP